MAWVIAPILLGIFLLYAFGFRYVLRYQLGPSALEARYFGFVRVLHLPYRDVDQVTVMGYWESTKYGVARRLGNRLGGSVVAVHRRGGLIEVILLTPDEPESFAKELRRRAGTEQ